MAEYKHIYFIGIGGIGMSAIARYYKFKGYEVSGYDKTPSELTARLEAEGIVIHYEDNTDFIPKDVEQTLVIYTPAIPADMGEFVYVQEHTARPPPVPSPPISSRKAAKAAQPSWEVFPRITEPIS